MIKHIIHLIMLLVFDRISLPIYGNFGDRWSNLEITMWDKKTRNRDFNDQGVLDVVGEYVQSIRLRNCDVSHRVGLWMPMARHNVDGALSAAMIPYTTV